MGTEHSSKVLTVTGVAEYLKIHPSTVYRLVSRGDLPAFKVGSDWRFNVEAIDYWRSPELRAERRHQRRAAINGAAAPNLPTNLRARAYQAWVREQAQALRKRDLEMLDWDNLAEILEDWAHNQK